MCKYLGCNISQLASRVFRFSKGTSSSGNEDEKLSGSEEMESILKGMKNVRNR
jgi:hypothetical protein